MRAARACASGRTPSWRRGRKRENDKRGLNRQDAEIAKKERQGRHGVLQSRGVPRVLAVKLVLR
jgi:hypothetical protein